MNFKKNKYIKFLTWIWNKIKTFLERIWTNNIIQIFFLFITIWIWFSANKISNNANNISQISYSFEKIKFYEERIKDSRDRLNNLYDKLYDSKNEINITREKVKNWTNVNDINALTKYVDELENVWQLYCDWYILETDILKILKRSVLDNSCYNTEILKNFSNKKNWFSLICSLFDDKNKDSMWKYYRQQNCSPLEKNIKEIKWLYENLKIPNNWFSN